MVRFVREGWPIRAADDAVEDFQKLSSSLTTSYGCLLYGARVVIPESLRRNFLLLLHEGHFGLERMKQLARTVVYWPNIDSDISKLGQQCGTCSQHQSATYSNSCTSMDDARESMEQNSRGSCYRLSGPTLVGYD